MATARDRGKLIFRKTERELLGLCSEERPEAVHGFRTATRRLQTLLEEVIPAKDRGQKKLLKMLNRIRKRAGKVRDVDVQLSALRSLKIPQEPRRKTQLTQNLIEVRARHEEKLAKLLKKDDVREIRKRLKRAERAVEWETAADALAVARRIVESAASPADPLDEVVLHRYRVAVKRARYAAEFAPKSDESTRFIAQLKRLQDALGNWHDWYTLTQTATNRLGDVSHSSLVALLTNVTRSKFRNASAAVSAAQAASGKARPSSAKSSSAELNASRVSQAAHSPLLGQPEVAA